MMPDNHAGDDRDVRIAQREAQVAELAARVGCLYTRFNLSPPFRLRDAAQHWVGLSPNEIARVVEDHLREHKRLYSGSGDGHFWMVEAAIRKAIEAKHPSRDDELERSPRSSSRVQKVHNASGFPDVYVEGRAARLVRPRERERPSLAGYTGDDRVGVSSLEDD
jgi:hypothetical protein